MNVAVTGAHGFVGLNVSFQLANGGHTVLAIGRSEPDAWVIRFLELVEKQVKHRVADLSTTGVLATALQDDDLDAVIHAAVVTATTPEVEREESRRILTVNIAGTIDAIELARERGARFVYVSSPSAIGSIERGEPIAEDVPLNPADLYGISKMTSEAIVRRYGEIHGLDAASVRIAQPYGPGERATRSRIRTSPIQEWLLNAERGETIPSGPLDRARDWTYIDDTACGIAQLATAGDLRHDLYHLSTGRQATIGEVLDELRREYPDLTIDEQPSPEALNPNISGPGRQPLDPGRFRNDFGWSPETSIQDGMRRYLEWWRTFNA
ncbi:MAG: NAD-dependent epimerase/dehydratase family protein [Chloroflexota bacterium]